VTSNVRNSVVAWGESFSQNSGKVAKLQSGRVAWFANKTCGKMREGLKRKSFFRIALKHRVREINPIKDCSGKPDPQGHARKKL
jgi:hypothetical protein